MWSVISRFQTSRCHVLLCAKTETEILSKIDRYNLDHPAKHCTVYMYVDRCISLIIRKRNFVLYCSMRDKMNKLRAVETHQAVSVVLYIFSFTLVVSPFFQGHSA